MLSSHLSGAQRYDYRSEGFARAFAFLERTDLEALPLGRVDIDGDRVYAEVQEYTTLPDDQAPFESHRDHFDVQYVVRGQERFGYVPVSDCAVAVDHAPDRDLIFYHEPAASGSILLRAGEFAVVSPEDAHAPRRQGPQGPCPVRKIVVKVRR